MTEKRFASTKRFEFCWLGSVKSWTWLTRVVLVIFATSGCGDVPDRGESSRNVAPAEPAVAKVESKPTEDVEFERANSSTEETKVTKPRRRRRKKKFPRKLSEYDLFRGNIANLEPAESVVTYDVNSRSFADYAERQRLVRLPAGTIAEYRDTDPFSFPVGTVVAKTFYYENDMTDPAKGRRLIETRILLHRSTGWIGIPYLWNEQQTDATLALAGATVDVSWIHHDGSERSNTYIVPNYNDCRRCHKNEIMEPIGLKARHLNRDFAFDHGSENQLTFWTRTGLLAGAPDPHDAPRLPAWNDDATGTLEQRARAWLEINCAHCHNPRGPARNSGLYLWATVVDPYQYGVYKTPVAAGRGAAGRSYDIVPGKPDESILQHRIESTDAGVLMPEFGRTVVHEEGVELIRQWIRQIPVPADLDVENAVGQYQSLSAEEIETFVSDVTQKGDASRGEEVFHRKRLNCLNCHAVAGVGGQVGPDLVEARPDKTIGYLVESLLLPNRVVRKGFETVNVTTDAGQVISGIKLRESDSEWILRDLTRQEIRIPRTDIVDAVPGVSLMPANIVAMLPRQDFLDVVRFLSELGQPGPFRHTDDAVVRRWEVLDPVPPDAVTGDPDVFVSGIAIRGSLIWEPAYSRVSGDLPISALSQSSDTSRRFIRFRSEFPRSGPVRLTLNSTVGRRMWLDGVPVTLAEPTVLDLQAGSHTLTFMIDVDQWPEDSIRCELGIDKSE